MAALETVDRLPSGFGSIRFMRGMYNLWHPPATTVDQGTSETAIVARRSDVQLFTTSCLLRKIELTCFSIRVPWYGCVSHISYGWKKKITGLCEEYGCMKCWKLSDIFFCKYELKNDITHIHRMNFMSEHDISKNEIHKLSRHSRALELCVSRVVPGSHPILTLRVAAQHSSGVLMGDI